MVYNSPSYMSGGMMGGYQMPVSYAPQMTGGYSGSVQPQPIAGMIVGVDGETAAKAYQMPAGLPFGTPIALWDTNERVIYMKTWNQMGMPMPLQKIHYEMDEPGRLPEGRSGQSTPEGPGWEPEVKAEAALPEPDKYVTKDDLEEMKNELKRMIRSSMRDRDNRPTNGGNA